MCLFWGRPGGLSGSGDLLYTWDRVLQYRVLLRRAIKISFVGIYG